MSDPVARLNTALEGRRVVFVASLLLLALGCGSSDEPGGGSDDPTGPSFSTLSITTDSVPGGIQGFPYAEFLMSTGGARPYTWSVISGSLPAGLSLTTNGDVTGTPTDSGSSAFTAGVTSGDGQTAQSVLSVTVIPGLQPHELCSEYPDHAVATFTDGTLRGIITRHLDVEEPQELTCDGVSQITILFAAGLYGSGEPAPPGISSLMGIQNFTNLTDVHLEMRLIADADLTQLSALEKLQFLDLSDLRTGSGTIDLAPLSRVRSLTTFLFTGNEGTDIGPLNGFTNLISLDLSHNSLTDIGALSGLTSLISLNLHANSIADISALSGLTSLTGLELWRNSLTDIGALSGLTSLTTLDLHENSIADVSVLGGLTSLTTLWIDNNSISDITGLSEITSVTTLDLENNLISDIGALDGLTSLTRLELSHNTISDISVLSGLASLTSLGIRFNSITDLSGLSGLTSLRSLTLSNNPDLSDIQPLLNNAGLGAGDQVSLGNTSVSCIDVTALRTKGVTVHSACR